MYKDVLSNTNSKGIAKIAILILYCHLYLPSFPPPVPNIIDHYLSMLKQKAREMFDSDLLKIFRSRGIIAFDISERDFFL